MIKNYLTVAFRNLWKNKVFSLINILGLAIGICASLIIFLIVQYDFTFDKFHKDKDRIYRVVSNFKFGGEAYHNSGVSFPMAENAGKAISGFEIASPFYVEGDVKIGIPNAATGVPQIFKKQKGFVLADENYFQLVPYQWLVGSPKQSLNELFQVVLTESRAKMYFPNVKYADLVGKEIQFRDTIRATITGIVKDLDENTDFSFKMFMSRVSMHRLHLNDWDHWDNTNSASQLMVKLSKGSSPAQMTKLINALYKKNHKPEPGDNSTTEYALQPLADIHFNSDYDNFDQRLAHKPTLYGLIAVASFLLILGCINFINLTTALSSQRAKEIGIRKTMGSSRMQLILQFLSETFWVSLLASLVSILMAPALLKVFHDFIPEELHFNPLKQPQLILFIFLLTIFVSLLSGIYPAFILSKFPPALVLKNQAYVQTGQSRKAWLRKSLTVFQFVIAQFFVMATFLVAKQIHYSLSRDLGFKKEAIIDFDLNWFEKDKGKRFVLADQIRSLPEVSMVSVASASPSSNNMNTSTLKYKDGKKEIESEVQLKFCDSNYYKLFGLRFLGGRSPRQTDTVTEVVINETYAHTLGFKNSTESIGKSIEWWNHRQVPIVGVVADFHQRSLHEPIKPLLLGSEKNNIYSMHVAFRPQTPGGSEWKNGISKIEKLWKEQFPNDEFDYEFLDATIAKFYQGEQHISSLLKWSTGLAIFISCLGLLGLVMYTTHLRTKEIGVRKVLGASVTQIFSLISRDFLKLVIIAFVIATPFAYWALHNWLNNFAYRTSMNWWVFAVSGAGMLVLALLILGFQIIRAATVNPVKSLRTE